MAAADNFPAFNAAVAELTLKVRSLIIDVTGAQSSLGPEVAAALIKLEAATTAANAAIAAADTVADEVAAVVALKDDFDAAMITISAFALQVSTLSSQVTSATDLMATTNASLHDALEQIDGISGNLAQVVKLSPTGITVAAHADDGIDTGHEVSSGGLMLLGVHCTTSTPLQMYDVRITVDEITLYDARGVLGPLNDTFSHFAAAEGPIEIILTNHGNAPALLTPSIVFTEMSIV